MIKIRRNEICPCGCGRKFKKCQQAKQLVIENYEIDQVRNQLAENCRVAFDKIRSQSMKTKEQDEQNN